jgi:hypothetical protein
MHDPRYHNYKLKSLVIKDKNKGGKDTTWGIVFYDSTKTNAMENQLKRQLRKAQEK